MRGFIYEVVNSLTLDANVSSSGADDPLASPDRPFIVIRSQTTQPALRRNKPVQQRFQVWYHDNPGSMLDIDDGIDLITDALVDRAATWWTNVWIMDVEHENTSPDLFDDHYKTNCRYTEILVTGKLQG